MIRIECEIFEFMAWRPAVIGNIGGDTEDNTLTNATPVHFSLRKVYDQVPQMITWSAMILFVLMFLRSDR